MQFPFFNYLDVYMIVLECLLEDTSPSERSKLLLDQRLVCKSNNELILRFSTLWEDVYVNVYKMPAPSVDKLPTQTELQAKLQKWLDARVQLAKKRPVTVTLDHTGNCSVRWEERHRCVWCRSKGFPILFKRIQDPYSLRIEIFPFHFDHIFSPSNASFFQSLRELILLPRSSWQVSMDYILPFIGDQLRRLILVRVGLDTLGEPANAPLLPNLLELVVSVNSYRHDEFAHLLLHCPRLEKLHWQGRFYGSRSFQRQAFPLRLRSLRLTTDRVAILKFLFRSLNVPELKTVEIHADQQKLKRMWHILEPFKTDGRTFRCFGKSSETPWGLPFFPSKL